MQYNHNHFLSKIITEENKKKFTQDFRTKKNKTKKTKNTKKENNEKNKILKMILTPSNFFLSIFQICDHNYY